MTNQGAPETTEQAPVPVQGEKEVIDLKVHKILKFISCRKKWLKIRLSLMTRTLPPIPRSSRRPPNLQVNALVLNFSSKNTKSRRVKKIRARTMLSRRTTWSRSKMAKFKKCSSPKKRPSLRRKLR